MPRKTVTLLCCDKCDRELRTGDGVLVCGSIYGAGETPDKARPLVGPKTGLRNGADIETALCWTCFLVTIRAPMPAPEVRTKIEYRTEYIDRGAGSSRSGGATGPLPPPELPRYVGVVKALVP